MDKFIVFILDEDCIWKVSAECVSYEEAKKYARDLVDQGYEVTIQSKESMLVEDYYGY